MSRIQQLVRPGHRAAGGSIALPLIALAAACIAFYAQAQVPGNQRDVAPQITTVAQSTTLRAGNVHAGSKPRQAYALVQKGRDGITMSGSVDEDLPAIQDARRSVGSDFIWFRRAGKAYVVTDPATVARAAEAWRESELLGAQMEALGSQMEVHGAKMEAIGAQMEKLSPQDGESPAMQAASRRMGTLAKQQEQLARQQSQLASRMSSSGEAEQDQLRRQMDALSKQQDALSRQMDQQSEVMEAESERLEAQMQPMEALSRQMDEAGKPLEALEQKMDALGEQHDKVTAQAERAMLQLIGEAMDKGLAKPAPGSVDKQ